MTFSFISLIVREMVFGVLLRCFLFIRIMSMGENMDGFILREVVSIDI